MRFYVTGRQMGKSTRMLEWMRVNPDVVMICHSERECVHLAEMSGLPSTRFITVRQAKDPQLRGRGPIRVGIDNLNIVLPILLEQTSIEILYVTATGENDV